MFIDEKAFEIAMAVPLVNGVKSGEPWEDHIRRTIEVYEIAKASGQPVDKPLKRGGISRKLIAKKPVEKRAYLMTTTGHSKIVYGVTGARQAYIDYVCGSLDADKHEEELEEFVDSFEDEESWTWSEDRTYPIEFHTQFEDGFICFHHIHDFPTHERESGSQPFDEKMLVHKALDLYGSIDTEQMYRSVKAMRALNMSVFPTTDIEDGKP